MQCRNVFYQYSVTASNCAHAANHGKAPSVVSLDLLSLLLLHILLCACGQPLGDAQSTCAFILTSTVHIGSSTDAAPNQFPSG